jgi:uncharacterized protein involved in propanediol utilization
VSTPGAFLFRIHQSKPMSKREMVRQMTAQAPALNVSTADIAAARDAVWKVLRKHQRERGQTIAVPFMVDAE